MNFVYLFIALISSLEVAVATNLRGRNTAQASANRPPNFICNVSEAHGINPEHELPHRKVCTTLKDDAYFPEKVYNLVGSTKSFFEGENLATGDVQISVNYNNVNGMDIVLDDDAIARGDITITYDRRHSRSRRKLSMTRQGTVKILVVRITDDSKPWGVTQSEAQLTNDVFDDENNAETVYRKCSNNQLRIHKATGSSVNNGVITVHAPENICSMKWQQVSDMAMLNLASRDFDATHKMLVMPNCVDFEGAEAWGLRPGTVTWFPSKNISFPVAQVHELGHNFGHDHSAKGLSPYGDDTGFMGNQALWTDEGSIMCFNAAKMWHFAWYSSFHRNVYPYAQSYKGSLAGLHDVRSGYVSTGSADFIVRAMEGDDEIYIMFNRMEGANRGVRGSQDMVTITRQHGAAAPSMWLGQLGSGQVYTYANWAGSGKNLIIKNCAMTFAERESRADIIMYVEGVTHAECEGSVSEGQCADIQGWYDADGPAYNCGWYSSGSNCLDHGDQFSNFGHTANSACCQCGGGIRNNGDDSSWSNDIIPVTPSPTAAPTRSPIRSPPSDTTSGCVDKVDGWHDSDGTNYNCEWYGESLNCQTYGDFFENFGHTANSACCQCGGGTRY